MCIPNWTLFLNFCYFRWQFFLSDVLFNMEMGTYRGTVPVVQPLHQATLLPRDSWLKFRISKHGFRKGLQTLNNHSYSLKPEACRRILKCQWKKWNFFFYWNSWNVSLSDKDLLSPGMFSSFARYKRVLHPIEQHGYSWLCLSASSQVLKMFEIWLRVYIYIFFFKF
jgi:hypothetical protein